MSRAITPAYIVTIDSVTLTRNDGAVVTAIATPEIIDFTQLDRYAEMWGSSAIPTGTYVSATITFDYTNAFIATMVNGQPQKATVLDYYDETAPTTYAITVDFDPANQPNITPTYASTSAVRLALDFDLAASGSVAPTSSHADGAGATVCDRDHFARRYQAHARAGTLDQLEHRSGYLYGVRAPVLRRGEQHRDPHAVQPAEHGLDGQRQHLCGLRPVCRPTRCCRPALRSAPPWTTFQPDYNPANSAYAGKFNMVYVVGASSLEDQYTDGLSGDVIARTGNTLTLLGSTLILNTANTLFLQCRDRPQCGWAPAPS